MIGKVITMDTPNKNGNMYPRNVVEKAFLKYKEDMIDKERSIVFSKVENDIEYAYGLVKDYKMEGDDVFIDVQSLTLTGMEVLSKLLEDSKLHFVTSGIGSIKDGIIQDDYILSHIFLTDDPSYEY